MKKFLVILLCLFLFPRVESYAVYNPKDRTNNKYGIHIVDENDLENAAKLVNSSGGDWGYVTLVIPENERKVDKWSAIFDRMRQLHLIPIVRIATKTESDHWQTPDQNGADSWSDFLNKLRWVCKNRYIILFNEPNHAKEWGGNLDPENYAGVVASFSASLKKASEDFFIMMAGFDSSAPNSYVTMDEVTFLRRMIKSDPDIFDNIDGWVSHSYPNPGYSGSPNASGRGTVKSYIWEEQVLKNLGILKQLPIFITETGWVHDDGVNKNIYYYSSDQIARFITIVNNTAWNNDDIVALTPFILNYQSEPFSHFSWQKLGSSEFYPQYQAYFDLPKVKGEPDLYDYSPTPTVTPQPQVLGTKKENTDNRKQTNIFSYLQSLFLHLFQL